MFKRRKKLTLWAWSKEQLYPRGGFRRSGLYLWHRLRRLPDPPHRVARGVFAGTFVNFPPIFGFQLIAAAALAWALRGNILAALLGTLLSNPLTTPIIAITSLKLGHWMLGTSDTLSLTGVFAAFGAAGGELWGNILAAFGRGEAHWEGLSLFWERIYLPYLVGSILPGILASLVFAWFSLPVVRAYQAMRRHRLLRKRHRAPGGDAPSPKP